MSSTLKMDNQFAPASAIVEQLLTSSPRPAIDDVLGRRKLLAIFDSVPDRSALPNNVNYEILKITTPDGYELPIWRIWKTDNDSIKPGVPAHHPAVLHAHSGGLICMSPAVSLSNLARLAADTNTTFFSVDYRLAPEHPYPVPLEDCWTGLKWVFENASQYSVDKTRIAVMGESAGGHLAVGLTLLARERGLEHPLKRQILAFPILDDRNSEELAPGIFSIWSAQDNLTAWNAYLGKMRGAPDLAPTAAPARLQDVSGLPPLYMDVGQLDLFATENLEYARKFIAAGIETEFHLYPGLPHGFHSIAPDHPCSKASYANRVRQLGKL